MRQKCRYSLRKVGCLVFMNWIGQFACQVYLPKITLTIFSLYRNCELAFTTAFEELSIPSLLDPDDVVNYEHPDPLSIMTYVSQYYHALTPSSTIKTDGQRRTRSVSRPRGAMETLFEVGCNCNDIPQFPFPTVALQFLMGWFRLNYALVQLMIDACLMS